MTEKELNEAIEALKQATQDYHKMSENCLYFDEHQYTNLMNLTYKLENELKQEKEKNKKLEEENKYLQDYLEGMEGGLKEQIREQQKQISELQENLEGNC